MMQMCNTSETLIYKDIQQINKVDICVKNRNANLFWFNIPQIHIAVLHNIYYNLK